MHVEVTCPDRSTLERLLLGQIEPANRETLESHVLRCSRCVETIESFQANDTLVEAMRSARQEELPRDDILAGLMQRLRELPVSLPTVTTPFPDTAPPPPDSGHARFGFLAPPERPDEMGRLGGYRILRVLGAGGMGVVFDAEDVRLGRSVALKVMKPELAATPAARERLLREARSMAAVRHDHVATLYEAGEDRGTPYLVLERLEGESLEQRLKSGAALPVAEVLRLGGEIAEGLAAAHARGLIHRDVKPGNIWLETRPLRSRVKLLDFGLARLVVGDADLTQSGTIVGTPAYLAPEQAQGKAVDHRCDLFSLGCVLYHLATGQPAFRVTSTMTALLSVALDNPQPPHELNPALPRELSKLILHLLEKDPQRRPATARTVADALQRIATTGSSARPVRSRRWLAVAAAMVVLLLPLGFFFGGSVIRFATNKGELVVETDDPNIEVTVKDGTAILHDRVKNRRFVLSAGDYEVEVREEGADGLRFTARKFTISRGGREVVNARLELANTVPPGEKKPRGTPPAVPSGFSTRPISPAALVTRPAPLPGVRSWTLETVGHRGFRESSSPIALSPDGELLATAVAGSTIRIYDLATGMLRSAWLEDSHYVYSLDWSPDGKRLASGSSRGAVVWDVATGRVIHRLGVRVLCVAWSPAGNELATCGDILQIWDAATARLLAVENKHGGGTALSWSPNGKVLAFGNIILWDRTRKTVLRDLKAARPEPDHPTHVLDWFPDGRTLASISRQNVVCFWDAETGQPLPCKRAGVLISGLAISPDGNTLATRESDGLGLCDPQGGKPSRILNAGTGTVPVWSRNGKTLAGYDGLGRVFAWDTASWKVRFRIEAHPILDTGKWSPDGLQLLQTNLGEPDVTSWDLYTGRRRLAVANVGGGGSERSAFAPDGKTLAVLNHTGIVFVDPERMTRRGEIPIAGPGNSSTSLAWSPDGARLVTASRLSGQTYVLRIWDVITRKELRSWKAEIAWLEQPIPIAWSPDGTALAMPGAERNNVEIWDTRTGQQQQCLRRASTMVLGLLWAPDGRYLAARSSDLGAIWDISRGGQRVATPRIGSFGTWLPESNDLIVTDYSSSGWLYRISPPNPDQRPYVKLPPFDVATFSRDGRIIGTRRASTLGATLWLWRIANGRPTGTLVALNRDRFLAVSPDGHYRASPGVETELVYVVQTDQGQQTLTPAEFAQKYHWKNDPDRVRPLGPDVPDSLDIESFPPPTDATPLFDDKPTHTVGETPLESKQKFAGRFRLHVEYRLPEAAATGGVEVQGRYRVLLTNSGGKPLDPRSSCGALSAVVAPKHDAARPPGTWQRLEVEFTSPVGQGGNVDKPGKLSVWLNDFPMQTDVEITKPTPLALYAAGTEPGPVVLVGCDKGVQFRNVWLQQLGE